jgi:hypothetical protein
MRLTDMRDRRPRARVYKAATRINAKTAEGAPVRKRNDFVVLGAVQRFVVQP